MRVRAANPNFSFTVITISTGVAIDMTRINWEGQKLNQGDSLLNSNSVPVKGNVDGDSVVIITLANNPSPDRIIASIDRPLAENVAKTRIRMEGAL